MVTDVIVCLRNENGIATLKMDSEVDDQDQNEMKLNYQVTHDSKINLIRISEPAGDKAWVLNDSINPNECDPIEEPMNIKK